MTRKDQIQTRPLTPELWRDFAALFARDSVTSACWCMWFRETTAAYREGKGAKNRAAFRAIVNQGPPPGVLAYVGGEPAGWCAVAPREEYGRLRRSRALAPVDDTPVWSVTCFFIDPAHRGRGVSAALLRGAIDLAAAHGGRVVEGYPVDPGGRRIGAGDAYYGVASMFDAAGFKEAARRTARRPMMRYRIR